MGRRKSSDTYRHGSVAPGILLVLVAVAGCTAPQPTEVPVFRQGVATADKQTASTFADINKMLRRQQLDRAARATTLSEDLFAEGIPADARATWSRTFRWLDDYAAKLERLLSPEQRASVEAELRKFGEQVSSAREEPLPEGVAGGFVKLGGLLVQIDASQDALATMRKVDPAVQDIFSAMADAIGSSHEEGVRLTVWTSWTTQLGGLQVEFLRAGSESAKRKVAEKYLSMMEERDANDQLLASLRYSLLSLASAHSSMAQGNPVGATALIGTVQDEYEAYREEVDRLRKARQQQ